LIKKKKKTILSNSNGASKFPQKPITKKTQIPTSNPPTRTTIKNQQPKGFPNENPKLSAPTKTKNKPKKEILEKTKRLQLQNLKRERHVRVINMLEKLISWVTSTLE
jgi:hypothetical protein